MALAPPWVMFSAMADVAQTSMEALGLVERVAALHRVQLFAGIPGRVLAAVAEGRRREALPIGEVLMEEGAVEAHLYAVVEGRVKVHRGDRTLVELGPGATVGELAVLVPAPRAASVTALEPTLALRVDQPVLDELLVDWPELAHGVIAELVSRLRATTDFADKALVSNTPRARRDRPADGAGARVRRDARARRRPGERDLPGRIRSEMAPRDLHRASPSSAPPRPRSSLGRLGERDWFVSRR